VFDDISRHGAIAAGDNFASRSAGDYNFLIALFLGYLRAVERVGGILWLAVGLAPRQKAADD
jgi:hypothetical protein